MCFMFEEPMSERFIKLRMIAKGKKCNKVAERLWQ